MSLDFGVVPTSSLALKKVPVKLFDREVVVKLPQLNASSSTVRLHDKKKDVSIQSITHKFWNQMIKSGISKVQFIYVSSRCRLPVYSVP